MSIVSFSYLVQAITFTVMIFRKEAAAERLKREMEYIGASLNNIIGTVSYLVILFAVTVFKSI